MWSFASNTIAGNLGPKKIYTTHSIPNHDCSDDEVSSRTSREEGLECPICWESFNIVENVPYVLWCGHTLCKNCVLGLKWAVVKFPSVPVHLPLFISCPWCCVLSFRLVYKGNLKFPQKNFFLLWMVESMNGDRSQSHLYFGVHPPLWPSNSRSATISSGGHHRRAPRVHQEHSYPNENHERQLANYSNVERINSSLRKSMVFFVHLTTKFPLVIIFLFIVLYAVPASFAILALYILVTVLFAVPSLLVLYFAYPSLEWLISEIIT